MKFKSGLKFNNATVIPEKIKESFTSVLPIALIVCVMAFSFLSVDSGLLLNFLLGGIFVIFGMGFFSLGADIAMTPIGEFVGSAVMKSKKLFIILPVFFVVGVFITVAEPDLQVLADLLSDNVNKWVLLFVVGGGVGIFLVIAFLKIIVGIKLSVVLILSYIAVFVLSIFVPENFLPLAFDSGGVTTGPMSVPFIIAIGTGAASIRSDGRAESDGFGLTALCSVGPIIAVMILGIIFSPEITSSVSVPNIENSIDYVSNLGKVFPTALKEIAIALSPMLVLFFVTIGVGNKISSKRLRQIIVGVLYTFVGLTLFMVGVESGFLPMGYRLGEMFGEADYSFLAVPIGMLLGAFVVAAEPAVHVLTKQVYQITEGAIPKGALKVSLMVGTAVSVGLAILRILLDIPIMYILIPVYAVSLILTFVVPEIFTAIAFDSGGVASGAMTASFIMPFALGLCCALGKSVALVGYGVVAFVAMTPPITIQILGLIYRIKLASIRKAKISETPQEQAVEEIID